MSHNISYSISDLFNKPESLLSKLLAQVKAIEKLNNTLSQVLETELIPHCRVGSYDNGVLTLLADSAAIATRLRYAVPDAMSKLRGIQEWAGLCSIKVKVQKHGYEASKDD